MFKPKIAQSDYTPTMLPHTRKEVFIDVVKLHFKDLFLCGVMTLIFSLPMHIIKLLEDFYISSVNSKIPSDATARQLNEAYNNILAFKNFTAIIGIIFILIFAVGFSGLMRVIRQYAWEENVFFVNDFFKGIKQNIKQTLLLGLIVGIMYAVSVYYYNSAPDDSGAVSYMFLIPLGVFILIVIPVAAYMTVCIPVYTNSFKQNIIIGLLLFTKHPIKTLLILAVFGILFFSYFMSSLYAHLLGRILCSLAAPFIMLAWYLFTYNQLDKYINHRNHPELVGRGTFQ